MSVEGRGQHCVVDRVEQSQLFVVEAVRDHLSLLHDQVGLMRWQSIEFDQEEHERQAINGKGLPEDGRCSTVQQEVGSELWRDDTEEDYADNAEAEVPADALSPGRRACWLIL